MLPRFYPLTRKLSPSIALPLTVADAKTHLRETEESPEIDSYIESLVRAAAEWWESGTNTALMLSDYVTVFGGFSGELSGLKTPLGTITSITYATDEDVNTAAVVEDYAISDGRPGVLLYTSLLDFPALRAGYAEPVRVKYTAGYAADTDVPELIKQALRLTVLHWYENRQNVVVGNQANEVPQTAQAILKLHREYVL